jgi:glycosidase
LALLFLLTEDGIPCIYYGTEQQFRGGNDPANREDLWRSGYSQSGDTYRWIGRLTALRKGYLPLRRGDTTVVWSSSHAADETDAGIFAFERTGGDAGAAYALVVLNANRTHPSRTSYEGPPPAQMQTSLVGGTVLVDVVSADQRSYTVAADGTLDIELPPLTGALLIPSQQVVPGL